jgi:hypothetical protein
MAHRPLFDDSTGSTDIIKAIRGNVIVWSAKAQRCLQTSIGSEKMGNTIVRGICQLPQHGASCC